MRRGFTLVELLTCISIILIIAGLSFPAFSTIKRFAKVRSASSNLHQLYVAASLYRTDNGGDAIYGDATQMGLPTLAGPTPTPFGVFMNSYKPLWKSPCGLNPDWYQPESWEPSTGPLINIIYRPADEKTYGAYAQVYRQNSLLFFDLNCDDPDSPIGNKYLDHRGIAVTVEGQLINQYKPGSMWSDSWWSTPPQG